MDAFVENQIDYQDQLNLQGGMWTSKISSEGKWVNCNEKKNQCEPLRNKHIWLSDDGKKN